MNFYKRKQTWKYILFIIAVIISSLSIYLTRDLENSLEESINSLSQSIETLQQNEKTLEREENNNMQTFAKALKHLNNMDPNIQGDFSFSMDIIKQNVNIPLILLDECNDILQSKNLNIPKNIDTNQDSREEYVLMKLDTMRKSGDSIIIDVAGEKQTLYYGHSDILKQTSRMHQFTLEKQDFTKEILSEMRKYPYYQLAFLLLFFILAYFIFNAARKSEQNLVWAGMAKETAHQIGTPLSSLMAWVQLLKENNGDEKMIQEMQKDLEKLETITDRFSKIGSKPELKKENISEIIKETISYMEKRFSKNITFNDNIDISSDTILLSKVLFIWVIENICKNAADAMQGKGIISISCNQNEKEIEIYISDTGKGIDKNILKSIFLPGITSKQRGWGLGLSLVKRIIEDYHKGKIFVANSNKEKGTTFCIVLPK